MAAESCNPDLTGVVDDFYFSALAHTRNDAGVAEDDDLFLISDEKYAAELQLQEVIMSSAIAAATSARALLPARLAASTNSSALPIVAIGECSSAGASLSSSSRPSAICMDAVPPSDAHRASSGCAHAFCTACLGGYIGAKIQDRIADVKCPEERCAGVLDPALCQDMLPREVFERWGAALCESMMLGAKRTYCPFKDCSAMMLVVDADDGNVSQSECQVCRRLFCARCGVPWHAGADCAAYKKLGKGDRGKEDMMLLEMAKGKKWKRCPSANSSSRKPKAACTLPAGASSSSAMDVATSGAGLILAAPQPERIRRDATRMTEWYLCKLCILGT